MSASIRAPRGPGWTEWPASPSAPLPPRHGRWFWLTPDESVGVCVVSSIDDTREDARLAWHVSVSRLVKHGAFFVPEMPGIGDVTFALEAFRMSGAVERNGQNDTARHFFRRIGNQALTRGQA